MQQQITFVQQAKYIQFGTLTSEQIEKLSVCEITKSSHQGIDKNTDNTPYDPRLGVLENGGRCATCGENNFNCHGHYGHIPLPVPMFNPLFKIYVTKLLQCVCFSCANIKIKKENLTGVGINKNKFVSISNRCRKIDTCSNTECEMYGRTIPLFDISKNKEHIISHYGNLEDGTPVLAGEALNILSRISNETCKLIGFNDYLLQGDEFTNENVTDIYENIEHVHQTRPESLIFVNFPVIPPRARPYVIRNGERCDDDITDKYNFIIKECIKLWDDQKRTGVEIGDASKKGKKRTTKLTEHEKQKVMFNLQLHINTVIYNKDSRSKLSSGGRPHKCLHARLQGKEAHMQTNIGGKRVDFSARSVIIGGGTILKNDELGVPRYIADKLTEKENVTADNINYINELVKDGKVNRVTRGNETIRLDLGIVKNFSIKPGDKVERKLKDGDPCIFNRQPSLRIESMMCFKAKIIDEYAFRLGLCWTSSFNADFDGPDFEVYF